MSKKSKIRNLYKLQWLAILSICLILPATRATTLAQLSLDQLTAAADGVARVRCAGAEAHWENGSIWTVTTFDVMDRIKGDLPSRITVRLPGGKVGAFTAAVEGTPKFSPNEEAIVFLERMKTGGYSVTGWVEGTFRIALDAKTHQEIVTQDSSAFAVFDSAGRTFHTAGIRNMPIELFRMHLAASIARAQEKSR